LALVLTASAASAVTITETFGVSSNFDDGPGSVSFSLSGLDSAVISDIAIDFAFFGDLNSRTENFELFLDGVSYGVGCDNDSSNDTFGIDMGRSADQCRQRANSIGDASLLVSATEAIGLLADGALDVVFNFTQQVNDFVTINNGGETRGGVFFGNQSGVAFGAGGTVTYETSTIAPIPVPPALPLLASGLLAFGLIRRSALSA